MKKSVKTPVPPENKSDGLPNPPSARVKIHFGIKLVAIVTVIVLGAAVAVTALVDVMVSHEFGKVAEDNNFSANNRAAAVAEEELYRVRSDALMLMDIAGTVGNSAARVRAEQLFFERNQDFAAVIVPGGESHVNSLFFKNGEADSESLFPWLDQQADVVTRAVHGEPVLLNATVALGVPLTALFYPWQDRGVEEAVIIFFSPDYLADIFGEGINPAVMVNDSGDVLIHPNVNQILSGANIADNPLFDALRKNTGETIRLVYSDEGSRFYGAGRRLSFAGASVLSSIEYSFVNSSIAGVTRRNIFISAALVFLAIIVTWFFSRTFTTPLKNLMGAAERIERGEFDLDLKVKSHDELGVLTERFIHMGLGLKEWERVKNLVGRFNSRDITEKARNGELPVSGELKTVTIMHLDFFSFNALSEKFSPSEAAAQMNRYYAKIATSVESNGGVVDRIAGLKVIAVWGAPLSSGSAADDAMKAISAALMMRAGLWELNSSGGEAVQPLFRAGCGIHTAEMFAGCLGSPSLMEYSFVGNAADEAGRAAEANKAAGSDIALSEDAWRLIGGQILCEEISPPQTDDGGKVFALINRKPSKPGEKQQWPFTMDEVRESLGIPVAANSNGKNENNRANG